MSSLLSMLPSHKIKCFLFEPSMPKKLISTKLFELWQLVPESLISQPISFFFKYYQWLAVWKKHCSKVHLHWRIHPRHKLSLHKWILAQYRAWLRPQYGAVFTYLGCCVAQGGQSKYSHRSLSPTILLTNVTNVNDPIGSASCLYLLSWLTRIKSDRLIVASSTYLWCHNQMQKINFNVLFTAQL